MPAPTRPHPIELLDQMISKDEQKKMLASYTHRHHATSGVIWLNRSYSCLVVCIFSNVTALVDFVVVVVVGDRPIIGQTQAHLENTLQATKAVLALSVLHYR